MKYGWNNFNAEYRGNCLLNVTSIVTNTKILLKKNEFFINWV